jgi:hypothetical protein
MKQVSVVRDQNGRVVATFEKSRRGEPQLGPALKPGHTVHDVEAEDDYLSNIKDFYRQHSN